MWKNLKPILINRHTVLYLIIAVLYILVFCVVPKDGATVDVLNNNASYHTLSMVKNLQDYSAKEHAFLPLVTMKTGTPSEWGACLKGNDGRYYYSSFMPLDVVVPYLFFTVTGLSLTPTHLQVLSLIFCYISTILLTKIIYQIFNVDEKRRVLVGALTAFVYLFSYEGLQCATNVFWGELLFQPVMLMVVLHLLDEEKHPKKFWLICIGICLGCMMDWSGFFFAAAVAFVYLFRFVKTKEIVELKHVFLVAISTISGGLIVIAHYSLKLGIGKYLKYCQNRFFSRSLGTKEFEVSIIDLFKGYINSFGPWLLLFIVAIAVLIKHKANNRKMILAVSLILLACFENVVMLEHAVEYTYDRIKFAPIMVIVIIGALIIVNTNYAKVVSTVIVLLVSIYCLLGYIIGNNGYVKTNQDYKNNYILAKYFRENIAATDSNYLVGLNAYCSVRGYINLLFDCNIQEMRTLDNLKAETEKKDYDGYVYITSDYNKYSDKYHYSGILVGNKNEEFATYYYVAENGKVESKTLDNTCITVYPLSDNSFESGVYAEGSLLRFEKRDDIKSQLENGTALITSSGDRYEIESVTVWDEYIDVKLLGDVNWWYMKDFEFPNKIVIE